METFAKFYALGQRPSRGLKSIEQLRQSAAGGGKLKI
jgi:hypothetical protein